jgi:hypothetical protein
LLVLVRRAVGAPSAKTCEPGTRTEQFSPAFLRSIRHLGWLAQIEEPGERLGHRRIQGSLFIIDRQSLPR